MVCIYTAVKAVFSTKRLNRSSLQVLIKLYLTACRDKLSNNRKIEVAQLRLVTKLPWYTLLRVDMKVYKPVT